MMKLIILILSVACLYLQQNLQIVNYSICLHENSETLVLALGSVMNGYLLVLFLFLFILSLLTASVPSSTFRREGVATYKAVVLTLLPAPFVFIARAAVLPSQNPEQFGVLFWIEFCWNDALSLILLAVLFAPTVSSYAIVHKD